MTEATEQERAEFELMRAAFELEMIDNHFYVPSDFRDAGLQSDGSFVDDDLNDAVAIWDAAWQAARRAQVVPKGWKMVPVEPTRAMMASAVMQAEGDAAYKVATARWLEAEEREYGAAYEAMLAVAPQPPEGLMSEILTSKTAAPVQLPEPAGWIDDDGKVFWNDGRRPDDGEIIYTDHQVRQLLAAQEQSHGK